MNIDLAALPADVDTLHQMVGELATAPDTKKETGRISDSRPRLQGIPPYNEKRPTGFRSASFKTQEEVSLKVEGCPQRTLVVRARLGRA